MFASYKKHNNKLYNNLVKLSRNKFFYQDLCLEDKIETRITLIFFHFALILQISKNKEEKTQDIFDNIFQNIEYNLREIGHGDVFVNTKMKKLTRVFYDILVKLDNLDTNLSKDMEKLIKNYFFNKSKDERINIGKLTSYFDKFKVFCFDLDVKNMLNGSFNFLYK